MVLPISSIKTFLSLISFLLTLILLSVLAKSSFEIFSSRKSTCILVKNSLHCSITEKFVLF